MAMPSDPAAPSPVRRSGFRPELHGLRGVAIALVVVYHVWLDRVSGGVDVFLFLSAFLLTGTFLKVADRGEAPRPLAYWARTFKRLLPPAVVVVLGSLAGVLTLLEADRWLPSLVDAAGSLLQVENWVLIQRGTDYYAADDSSTSVLQHFWSLSIQGQVFLAWPVLIGAVVLLARALRLPVRGSLTVVFALVTVSSLAWSVRSTATQQTVAYFDTLARLWEFGAGSLLALALIPSAAAAAAGGGRRRADLPRRCLPGWPVVCGQAEWWPDGWACWRWSPAACSWTCRGRSPGGSHCGRSRRPPWCCWRAPPGIRSVWTGCCPRRRPASWGT